MGINRHGWCPEVLTAKTVPDGEETNHQWWVCDDGLPRYAAEGLTEAEVVAEYVHTPLNLE